MLREFSSHQSDVKLWLTVHAAHQITMTVFVLKLISNNRLFLNSLLFYYQLIRRQHISTKFILR